MNETDKCQKLAGEITSYFNDGIILDNYAKDYINTCFPDTNFQDLVYRICKNPDFDDAPLLELIFFPDEVLQVQLEPLLEKHAFVVEDENELTRLLLEANLQTTLRETGSDTVVPIKIPTSVFPPFVRRLKISRQIPQRLIDTLHEIFPAAETAPLKVQLRNARFTFSTQIIEFLGCFFRGINSTAEYFYDCLDLAMSLLDEQKHESDPYLLPIAKRDVFIRAKKDAAEFMQKLQRSNMETLMHRGIRAPEIGIGDAERKIELLERIIIATKHGGDRM